MWTKSGHDCPGWAGDLNWLEGTPGQSGCVNGAGLGNAPTGDWFFVEYNRHVNPANYYASQRAVGMNGSAAGQTWIRSQQSGTAGTGWGAWTRGVNVSGDTMTGRLSTQTEDWGVVLRNGAGADNAQPQSGVGSAYVNDVYIRSVGKWASQLGGPLPPTSATFGTVVTGYNGCWTVPGSGQWAVSLVGWHPTDTYISGPYASGVYVSGTQFCTGDFVQLFGFYWKVSN